MNLTRLSPADIERLGAFSAAYQRVADAMLPLMLAVTGRKVTEARAHLATVAPALDDGDAKAAAVTDVRAREVAEHFMRVTRRVIVAFDRLIAVFERGERPDAELMAEFGDSNVAMREAEANFADRLATATIRLDERFTPDALAGPEEFSHLEVLYHFHLATEENTGARRPRGNPDWPLVGIFAQRGKDRPNRLGVSTCAIEGCASSCRVGSSANRGGRRS